MSKRTFVRKTFIEASTPLALQDKMDLLNSGSWTYEFGEPYWYEKAGKVVHIVWYKENIDQLEFVKKSD